MPARYEMTPIDDYSRQRTDTVAAVVLFIDTDFGAEFIRGQNLLRTFHRQANGLHGIEQSAVVGHVLALGEIRAKQRTPVPVPTRQEQLRTMGKPHRTRSRCAVAYLMAFDQSCSCVLAWMWWAIFTDSVAVSSQWKFAIGARHVVVEGAHVLSLRIDTRDVTER